MPRGRSVTLSVFDSAAPQRSELAFTATSAQHEVWAATQLGADAALACHDAVLLHVRGRLDVQRLRDAIHTLVARHESLRATFSHDGTMMRVASVAPANIVLHDWTARSGDERDAALAALRRSAVVDAYDLEHGPLVRFTIVTFSDDAHAVVIAAHEIVCDALSHAVLVDELGSLYDAPNAPAADDKHTREMRSSAASFCAYAAGQQTPTAIARAEADERYWQEQFATLPRQLDLPTDRVRPPHPSYRSAREDHTISAELTREIVALSGTLGTSVAVTLLGSFAVLLARLSGQDDIVIGLTVPGQAVAGPSETGQPTTDMTGLIGHCANTRPMRVQVPSLLAFDALLTQLSRTTSDARAHQHSRLGRIATVGRDAASAPLVSTVFNVSERRSAPQRGFRALNVTLERLPRCAALVDLAVHAIETDNEITLECQYNPELFDAGTVRRWLASYEQLLRAAIAQPATPIGRLAIRTRDDEAALDRCNTTSRAIPANLLVHELVEAEAEREPDRVAVEQDGVLLRYDELNARANQLAHHLRGLGVQRGELVGLLLDRTPDTIIALLAVLKAGAGYVPLDPVLPVERLERMATDAALAALITNERIRDDVNISAREVVSIDGDAGVIALSPPTNPPRDEHTARASDTAYVIFTSGSTGRPKGVLVPHIGLLNLALSLRHTPGMHRDDVVLAITTLVFDVAVSEVLVPLTLGARIVLASRETAADGTQLRRVVESRGVTVICSAPATYHLLLEAGWTGDPRLTIICTGEAMPRELAATLVHCGRAVWNAYGPSETTVWSTFHRVAAPVQRVLIGRPVDNTCVAVRDLHGEQVPIGVVGELYIGGAGVATGYLNLDEATAARFQDDPHQPGLRWYRTGDLARLLVSGELECLGRVDDQIKVRGYRIEPGEIAVVVSQWPGVRQAVVIAREDRTNDVRLVAYVIADAGTRFDDDFRAHLKRILPQYMVPAAVVALDAFPLTASGKVDRKRLPAPAATDPSTAAEFVAPRTPTEHMLVGIWEETLGGRVGIRDDFFALGGHSLLASQILSRLRRDHGVDLSFRRIFESPTVELLARVIEDGHAARTVDDNVVGAAVTGANAIVRRAHTLTAPLTAQQERLWMLEELEPRCRRAHSHPAAWNLHGPLDEEALRSALQALAERHPMLRTSFHWHNGNRQQRINEHVTVTLARVDLSHIAVEGQTAALQVCFAALHEVPFDIGVAPLFRATLITLGRDRHQLYTLQHGLIWDGWSFDLFVRDLGELYAAGVERRSPMLAPLSVTFGDFAAWQQQWIDGPAAHAQQAWWNQQLAGVREAVTMPTDRPRPLASSYAGDYVSIAFTTDEVSALHRLARRYDSTLYMVLLAAYAALLHRYTGQRDLLVASPMRARTQTELENVLGSFVNAVVLRVHMDAASSFADLVRRVRDTALDTYAHQELPFELLGGRLPSIRTVFSLQDARERPRAFGPLEVELAPVPLQYATNDLTLWMQQYPTLMSAVLNFSTELFDAASAQLFLEQLRALLTTALAEPDRTLGQLALVTEADGVTTAALPVRDTTRISAPPVLSAIARIAIERESAIAVQGNSARETFGALWTRAGAIAAALTRRGIGSDAVVAVSLPSNVESVVAMLGVLRAGAQLLVMSPDDGVEFQARVLTAASPTLRIGVRADAGTVGTPPTLTLAVLAAEGEGAAAPVAIGDAGIVMAWTDIDGGVRIMRIPMARADAQAGAINAALALTHDVSVCFAVPTGAAAHTLSLLAVLAAGARIVLADEAAVDDAHDFGGDVAAAGCTRMIATAEAWRTTLNGGWSAAPFDHGVLIGGGLLPQEMRDIASHGTALWSATGGEHDGTVSASLVAGAHESHELLGAPIGDGAFRVVDSHDRPTPVGMLGWLASARAGLDTTWVRTGLAARRTVHGEFQLLAGVDPVVWRDGVRINTPVLELMIRRVPGVADAAVRVHVDARGRPWLVAHVVPDEGWDVGALRAQCRMRLPAAWLPKRFVVAVTLPRTADGSVDRAALPSPFDVDRLAADLPRTDVERDLMDVWTEVLGVERVGRGDNFFARGGTSLSCFRAIELIRRRTKVRLSPRVLLTGTLAQAAEQLAGQHAVQDAVQDAEQDAVQQAAVNG